MRLSVMTLVMSLISLSTYACCSEHKVGDAFLSTRTIMQNPTLYGNKEVKIVGYLQYNQAIVPFLYENKKEASRKNFASGLDAAIPDAVYRPNVEMVESGHCVAIVGKFAPYDKKTIKLDYASSPIGRIIADSITPINCFQAIPNPRQKRWQKP